MLQRFFTPLLVVSITYLMCPESRSEKPESGEPPSEDCNEIVKVQSIAPATVSTAKSNHSIASYLTEGSLVFDGLTLEFAELTTIRHGNQQFAPHSSIDGKYVAQFQHRSTPQGEQTSVQLLMEQLKLAELPPSGGSHHHSIGLMRSGGPSTQQGSNISRPSVGPTAQDAKNVASSDRIKLMYEYLEQTQPHLSMSTRDMVVPIMINDESMVIDALKTRAQALAKAAGIIETDGTLTLSNLGDNQYFEYIPTGDSDHRQARVLDIHRTARPEAYTVLTEFIQPEAGVGQRARRVSEITLDELRTARRGDPREIEEAFNDSTTPIEIATRLLAHELKMPTFGFTVFGRNSDIENLFNGSPLMTMNNITYLAIAGSLENHFGGIDDLYDAAAKNGNSISNVIDLFASLKPRYVARRFFSTRFEYLWVITQDGSLKICPKMAVDNNLKAQTLRLASGRRIFAGGNFTFNRDGTINVEFDSNSYQALDSRWGSNAFAFAEGNPNLHRFVGSVFAIQGGLNAYEWRSQMAEQWARGSTDFDGSGTDDFQFFESFLNRFGKTTKAKVNTQLTWNSQTEAPPTMVEWLSKQGLSENSKSDRVLMKQWAYYVLQVNPDMTNSEIKKAYRQLSHQFHPDVSKIAYAESAFKVISEAWSVLNPRKNRKKSEE